MTAEDTGVVLKRFEAPDEVRTFEKGRLEIVRIGSRVIGRASYEPGWRWSQHVGLVVSGTATCAFRDGPIIELKGGFLFWIPATPHDSWVVGERPYVSLHFMGAEHYAR